MTEHVQVEKSEGILTLVLDRPAKKNALTAAMYDALATALEAAERDGDVRVVLLRGNGDAFTAGNDIGEFAAVAMGGGAPENALRFIRALARATKPLVAAVQGRAVGVGTTLLLHCDYVILGDDAKLSTPFVQLALVPEAASSLLLPARIGHARAFAMFALGEVVDAKTALSWGLANQVVARPELAAAAEAVARRIAALPLGAVVTTKTLMRSADALVERIGLEGGHFAARLMTAEAREAFTAFAERRAPDFRKLGAE